MSIATVPHADAVDGNLMEAAKPMLLLGWSVPAVLTARVLLERAVTALVIANGIRNRVPPNPKFYKFGRALRRIGVIDEPTHDRIATLYGDLSAIAHGRQVGLYEAVQLVQSVEGLLRKLTH